jgi:hypothetical protein
MGIEKIIQRKRGKRKRKVDVDGARRWKKAKSPDGVGGEANLEGLVGR